MSAVINMAIIDQTTDIKSPCEIHIANKNTKDKISMNIALINKAQRGTLEANRLTANPIPICAKAGILFE